MSNQTETGPNATTGQTAQLNTPLDMVDVGSVSAATTVQGPEAEQPDSRARGDPLIVKMRIRAQGDWTPAVEELRNKLMKACRRRGMSKTDAQGWTYAELDRLYPPPPPEPDSPDPAPRGDSGQIKGLSNIPTAWPELPANAGLQAEIGWVQANRLLIVKDKPSGATVVDLSKAHEPAPSRAALGWLETSIRAYAKYVDIVARSLATQTDDQEHVRRERVAIDDIRALLDEMHVDPD